MRIDDRDYSWKMAKSSLICGEISSGKIILKGPSGDAPLDPAKICII